jgi:dolichyl-phosphate-mannose-protein mannosyltransferase
MAFGALATQRHPGRRPLPVSGAWIACGLLIAAALGVWTHRLGLIDLDDAASNEVIFARRPLLEVVGDVPWSDQSPLAFVLLHFWRRLGEDPATIKQLNLVLLAASLLVFHAVARRLCPRPRVALGAIVLATLSPASLWAARNGRMYSLQMLLWMLALLFMARYAESRRPRDLCGIVLATLLGTYNHFIGFVSTATVVLWLVVEAVTEARLESPADRSRALRQRLGPPVAAALALLLLAEPETMRLLAVLRAPPPVVAGQALPGGWLHYVDAVSSFWFMNAGWGGLEPHAAALRAAYLASAYLLFVMGLARGSGRLKRLVLITVLFPLVVIGFAAGTMDFRDRHLLYLLPLVWLAIANGALAGEADGGLPIPRALAAAAIALLVAVSAASAWLVYCKLPERYVEWTKLVRGVLQVSRPNRAVYMVPSPFTGAPELIASRLAPRSAFVIRPLTEEARLEFLAAASEKRDCVFLWQEGTPHDPEQDWRAHHLGRLGYRRLLLSAAGATAEVFTAGEWPEFSSLSRLPVPTSSRGAMEWARTRLQDPSRWRDASSLGGALVARVEADGTARESRFFMSQGGESGYWRLTPADEDRVEQVRTTLGGVEAETLVGRVTDASLLLIVFPALDTHEALRLTCGAWPVSSSAQRGVVSAEVFVADEEATVATCPLGRSEATVAETSHATSGRPVTLALSAVGMDRADVLLRLEPIRHPPAREDGGPRTPPPVAPARAGTLKDELGRLRVYRTSASGFGRVPGRFQSSPRPAAVMHEVTDGGNAGGIGPRWELGELPWDAVGLTLQESNHRPRWGLWAHPKDGTRLVIEADDVVLPHGLAGFYGLTDFSIEQAQAAGLTDPIEFRVRMAGQLLLAQAVPRVRGWTPLTIAAPEGVHGRLRVEVAAARDTWAHFVFDLWPR